MTLLIWNARGLCSSERQTELKRMCNENLIEIFGVLETKTMIDKFKDASYKMGSEWSIMRNRESDNRDSIWIGWNKVKWKGIILCIHEQFIHARLLNNGGYEFDITVAYGDNTPVKRRRLWYGINSSRPASAGKDWLLIGDFNKIRHLDERDGHESFDRVGVDEFESAIVCFTELEAIGGNFTWTNGVGPHHTRSRLDRALGNQGWISRDGRRPARG